MAQRTFTFAEARALIPEVREVTREAQERAQALSASIAKVPRGSAQARKLKEWIDQVVSHWAERIENLGGMPKGVWTVDFDSGDGYFYCWTYDEEDLGYYHLYEEGFPGRKPLDDKQERVDPPMLLN